MDGLSKLPLKELSYPRGGLDHLKEFRVPRDPDNTYEDIALARLQCWIKDLSLLIPLHGLNLLIHLPQVLHLEQVQLMLLLPQKSYPLPNRPPITYPK